MNSKIIFLIEESVESGYEARALGYSIFTEADSYEELKILLKMLFNVILKMIICQK